MNPKVFRKAAELIGIELDLDRYPIQFACHAIKAVTGYVVSAEHIEFFEYWFKPQGSTKHAWLDENDCVYRSELGRERRRIALLLAAEILESGG